MHTVEAEGFQMPDQVALACAGLGEALDAFVAKIRNQRQRSSQRRRVEVQRARFVLVFGSLAHAGTPSASWMRSASGTVFRYRPLAKTLGRLHVITGKGLPTDELRP